MNDFFIITSKEMSPRIYRLSLDKDAQQLLNDIFFKCYTDFNTKKASSEIIDYYAGYDLAKNELFQIKDFDDKLNIQDIVKNPTGVSNINFDKVKLSDICSVFTVKKDTNECLIQYINSSNILDLSRTLMKRIELDKSTLTIPRSDGISLAKKLTGIVNLNDRKFIFSSFPVVGRIFDMQNYFKEITNEMLVTLVNDFFETNDDNFDILDIANDKMRNSAAKIINLEILENLNFSDLSESANKVDINCCKLNEAKTKLVLPNKAKEINELFSFLNSLIYISAVTGERMKASSSRPY